MVAEAEAAQIVYWVAERFVLDLGIPYALAMQLALAHADWHEVEELIAAGCDPGVAVSIVL